MRRQVIPALAMLLVTSTLTLSAVSPLTSKNGANGNGHGELLPTPGSKSKTVKLKPRSGAGDSPLSVVGEVTVVVTKLPFDVVCEEEGTDYRWTVPVTWKYIDQGNRIKVTDALQGEALVQVRVQYIDFEKKSVSYKNFFSSVTVGMPAPVPPIPPDPKPKPDPLPPVPPGTFPLSVLVVVETAKTLPAGQNSIIYGKTVRDYLKAKCANDPTAKDKKAYRLGWDKDDDTSNESKLWRDSMVLARNVGSVPAVVINQHTANADGSTAIRNVHAGPLPANVTDMMALLKKFGG